MDKTNLRHEPPRISRLQVKNFRGFGAERTIQLAPLTYLVGPNSSGKSSLADAVLFVAQTGVDPSGAQAPNPVWSGNLVDLGSFKDAVYRHHAGRQMSISLTVTGPDVVPWRIRSSATHRKDFPISLQIIVSARSTDLIGRIRACCVTDETSGLAYKLSWGKKETTLQFGHRRRTWSMQMHTERHGAFEQWLQRELKVTPARSHGGPQAAVNRLVHFATTPFRWPFLLGQVQRVSSGRAGPKRWYPLAEIRQQRKTSFFGAQQTFEGIDPEQVRAPEKSGFRPPGKRLSAALSKSLGKMMGRLNIASSINDSILSAYHSAIQVRDNVTGIESNLIDVGYGASQVLPVLLACFSDSLGPLFVEQPEIHLHPKAQGVVGDLLIDTSKKRQVIVETHSAHMINRARIAVAKGEIRPDHVIIHYVHRTASGSRVVTIPIGPEGEFLERWPSGFFDERYEDTKTLLQLKGK